MKTTTQDIKFTPAGQNYFNGTGIYQKEYDELYEKYVPSRGSAETVYGELIRAVSRLYHEWCNNGNCNAGLIESELEEDYCGECGGSGEVGDEEDCEACCDGYVEEYVDNIVGVVDFYNNFLELIGHHVPNTKKVIEEIRNIIINENYTHNYNDTNYGYYNELADRVIAYILDNPNGDKTLL